MKLRPTASRTSRLKRFTFRAALIGCIGVPLVVVSEDLQVVIRPRTDRHVQSDIQDALAFHRRLPTAQETKGLTELAQSNTTSSAHTANPSNIVIGGSTPTTTPDQSARPPIVIGSEVRDATSGVYVTPRTDRRLPPPTISQIPGWEPDRRDISMAEARLASASRQWKPVRAQIGLNDPEASVRPELSGSIAIGSPATSFDSAIAPANYQSTSDGFSAPGLPFNPGTVSSGNASNTPAPPPISSQQQVLPGTSSPSVMPGPPVTYSVPGSTGTVMPGTALPYNPSNLPTYSSRGTSIIHGEPFVTAAPCQFDAYDMIEPTFAMQNPPAGSCGQSTAPVYPGIPGNIVPPTVMPNQAPPGIYSSNQSGFRPLIGFGQGNYNVQLGRGIIGQPVAYVPGQPLRNFLRYIFP